MSLIEEDQECLLEDDAAPLRIRPSNYKPDNAELEEEKAESVLALNKEASSKLYDSEIFVVTNTTFYGGID
jgi:hypothetical protein